MSCCNSTGTGLIANPYSTYNPFNFPTANTGFQAFTVGNQTRFFSSDPCCSLNSQRFLLGVDKCCCKIRHSVPSFPVVSGNNIVFI